MRFEKDWGRLGLKYKEVNLGELVSFVSKGIPPKYIETKSDNTIVVLNQRTNRNFQIDYSLSRLNDLLKKKVPTNKILIDYDILINSTGVGTAGRVAQLVKVPELTTVDGHMIIVRPDEEKIDPLYLGYALKAQQVKIEGLQEGSTGQTELNRQRLLNDIIIQFPESRKLQQDISRLFFSLDEKIENNKKINHHLAAISKNYLKIFYSSNSIKLGDIFELKSGYAFKSKDWVDEGKPVIKIKDIDGITIDITNLNYVKNKSQLSKASNFEVFGKEIVMALTGATTGKIGVIPKNFKGYVNQRVGLFYAKTELSYAVLWSILQQQNIITDLIKLSSGSAQANLSPFSVNSYDLNVTFKDLIELDKVLSPLYELFCSNLSEIQRLSKLRDTLLPKLLSGELSVNQAIK